MKPEECGICHEQVSFSQTIHAMIHTHSDDGVLDYYVCQSCYEDDLRPLFAEPETENPEPDDAEPETDGTDRTDSDGTDHTDLDTAEP